MAEITLKDLYDIIDKRITSLETEVREYNRSFVKFEEGKVSDLIQRVTKLEGENERLKELNVKEDKKDDQIKIWMWGAVEKILFMVIGASLFLAREVLTRLHIFNLQ